MGAASSVLLWAILACGQTDPTPAAISPVQIESAIKQLGAEQFQTREDATELLVRAGEAVRSAVESAAKSSDPEVALRAKIILQRLIDGIGPNTPPLVVNLIKEFRVTDRNGRMALLQRIKEPAEFEAAWNQINRLNVAEERPSLESMFRSRLTSLVSEQFQGGKLDAAEKLLTIGAKNPQGESALHAFWLATGRLPAKVAEAESAMVKKDDPAALRKLALLHRTAGELPKALKAAYLAGEKELSMWLLVEMGDWASALEVQRSLYADKEPTLQQLAFTVALSRQAGDTASLSSAATKLKEQVQSTNSGHWTAAEALLIAERYEEAIALQETAAPARAFYLLWFRHEYQRAFALAKAEDGVSLDTAWYEALPDGPLLPGDQGVPRRHYARDIARGLHYVGRRDDASRVLALIREGEKKARRPDAEGLLLQTYLRMGNREQSLAEAATLLTVAAARAAPRPAEDPFAPAPAVRVTTAASQLPTPVVQHLYDVKYLTLCREIWPELMSQAGGDKRAALDKLEQHLHPPARARLTAAERRDLVQALIQSPTPRDRNRHATYLRAVGQLCDLHEVEELAHRAYEQARALNNFGGGAGSHLMANDALQRKDWLSALKWYERAEGEGLKISLMHAQRGVALLHLGRTAEGQKSLDAAIAGFGPQTYLNQASQLSTAGLPDAAKERLLVAIRLMPPGDQSTIFQLNAWGNAIHNSDPLKASELWRINMLQPLIGDVNFTLDLYLSNNNVIHRARAKALLSQGQVAEAAEEARLGQEAMPGNVEHTYELVPLFDAAGQTALADALFDRTFQRYVHICDHYPGSTEHRRQLARLCARCGRRLPEAEQTIRTALTIEPNLAEHHATLAEVLLARGDRPGALAAAQRALALDPSTELVAALSLAK